MELLESIIGWFGTVSVSARAPGRVNLIGDHVDYCGGLVMPIAIDRECVCAIQPDATDASSIVLASLANGEERRIDWDDALRPGVGAPRGSWCSYVLGVIAGLCGVGSVEGLRGCRVVVASTVPTGAGLSSSAALEVSVAVTAAAHCAIEVGGLELARLCQKAEHVFAGVPCGLMDQAIAVMGRENEFLLLDCSDESTRLGSVPESCELVVINSGVRHALADGAYERRRESCERAAESLGVRHLAHADDGMVRTLDPELRPFARHVVSETGRVRQMVASLARDDLASCGELMNASHASLRDNFRVSCKEVDEIVDVVQRTEGVYGARMTGGGFGGCVISLARKGTLRAIEESTRDLCDRYAGLEVMRVNASAGASVLTRR